MNFKTIKTRLKMTIAVGLITCLLPLNVVAAPTSKSNTQTELSTLESQLKENLNQIDELEQQLIEIGEKIEQNKEDLKTAETEYNAQSDDVKTIIQFLYEHNTDTMKTEKVIESKSIASMTSDIEHINQIENYSKEKLYKFKTALLKVQTIEKDLEKEETELKEKENEFKKNNEELEKQINEKKIELATLYNDTKAVSGIKYSVGENASIGEKVVAAAYSQLGVPYVWGGTTPNSALDCSGLTQYCYAQAGISIPRTSSSQRAYGVVLSSPEVGCIVSYPGHVGIYIGDNKIIHAPQPGDVVKISNVWGNPTYIRMY